MRPRTKTIETSRLSAAVAQLRQALGQTQQQFAQTVGTSINTIARYETDRNPGSPKLLSQFYALALEQVLAHPEDDDLSDLKDVFYSALLNESPFWRGRLARMLWTGASKSMVDLADILRTDKKIKPETKAGILKVTPRLEAMMTMAQLLDPFYYQATEPASEDVVKAFRKIGCPDLADDLVAIYKKKSLPKKGSVEK